MHATATRTLFLGSTSMQTLATTLRSILLLAAVSALADCGRSQLEDYQLSNGGAPSTGCATNTDCPTGEECNSTTHVCVPIPGGCNSDAACGASTPHCRLDTHTCVECVTNTDCPSAEECSDYHCVGYCGGGAACSNGLTCCDPLCVDTTSNPTDCGGCNNVCGPYANSVAACYSGSCALGGCSPGFADCDHILSNGCETNIGNDWNNCGSCSRACPTGDSCSGGVCVGNCGANQTCPSSQVCCGATCANASADNNNCGGCGIVCAAVPHGVTGCVYSACGIVACNPGFDDCDGQVADGCETNTSTDPNNCGTCNNVCGANFSCVSGICQPNSTNCKITGCAAGLTCCGTTCVNTSNGDINNCGGCGDTCPAGTTMCQNGACCTSYACSVSICPAGQNRCNNACVDPSSDPNNCGGCDISCPPGSGCANSVCTATCNGGPVCAGVQSCCGSGCTDTTSDPNNCGSCGNFCPPGFSCVYSTCTAACNGAPVCTGAQSCCGSGCTDTTSDPNNCGSCNVVCAPGSKCVNSTCTVTCNGGPACTGAQVCCAAGCSTTATDPNNCGGCGNLCAIGDTCANGQCLAPPMCNGGPACSPGYTCCAGTGCLNLTTDPGHCGTCTTVCPSSQTCVGGACTASEGALDLVVNPTYISPGVHHYTSINIPAGVTLYVAGSGAQSGTLDLQSDGPIVVDGTIDVSGGPGMQDVISSGNTQLGRAGSGGYTGEPYESAPQSSQCAFVAGNPGLLGMGIQGSSGTCPIISTTTCTEQYDSVSLLWTSPVAQFGGGAGVFTGYRAYASGGGGPAGGGPGALCPPYSDFMMGNEQDCSGVSGGGGAVNGNGGYAGIAFYNGAAGTSGQTQCPGLYSDIPPACVGGGGGGSIGVAAARDLGVFTTFQTGSGGGGGSADYLNRPVYGGTSGGGGGGGALRLTTASTITVNGQLLANGGPGGDAGVGNGLNANCDPQPGAAGGGGSGGVIYLSAPAITVSAGATISAIGGFGGYGSEFATGGSGGSGGPGRIRLSVTPAFCTLSGSFNPPIAAGCTATSQTGATYVGVYPN